MAKETRVRNNVYLELTRKEAALLITTLVSEIGGTGTGPAGSLVYVVGKEGTSYQMIFSLDEHPSGGAREVVRGDIHVVMMSLIVAVDVVSLLTAQLAGVTLVGRSAGAVPDMNILERGKVLYRLVLGLEGRSTA